jgi:hypothetical protein
VVVVLDRAKKLGLVLAKASTVASGVLQDAKKSAAAMAIDRFAFLMLVMLLFCVRHKVLMPPVSLRTFENSFAIARCPSDTVPRQPSVAQLTVYERPKMHKRSDPKHEKTQLDYLSKRDTAHSSERFFNAVKHPDQV